MLHPDPIHRAGALSPTCWRGKGCYQLTAALYSWELSLANGNHLDTNMWEVMPSPPVGCSQGLTDMGAQEDLPPYLNITLWCYWCFRDPCSRAEASISWKNIFVQPFPLLILFPSLSVKFLLKTFIQESLSQSLILKTLTQDTQCFPTKHDVAIVFVHAVYQVKDFPSVSWGVYIKNKCYFFLSIFPTFILMNIWVSLSLSFLFFFFG